MPSSLDLEADLEALDAFLMSDTAPDGAMGISDLDGFLTGLAIGPELILPSEWLARIWGADDEPVFDDAAEAELMIGVIMRRYNDILGEIALGSVSPIFMETTAGEVIAADWAEGFMDAVALRPSAWDKLFKSERHSPSLVPILGLCCDENGEPLLDLPPELDAELFAQAGELIPPAVLDIAGFWRARRTVPQRRTTGPKTARNDPCPCGSGKKFKKCCGQAA